MPHFPRSVRILLTATEAYPALERAFLAARTEVWASFPVFDLGTPLLSPEGKAVGRTWFDLIVHVLNRGVALHLVISDVDPVTQAARHRTAAQQMRRLSAAAAVARPGARLVVHCLRHPARTGALLRVLLWPHLMRQLSGVTRWLNRLSPEHRAAALRDMDGTMPNLRLRRDGTLGVRLWALPRLHPAVHHQKLAVFDRTLLYIGGLDLDARHIAPGVAPTESRAGDQTAQALQLMIEGPAVAEAQHHLETFQDVIEGRAAPPKTRRLLRTLSQPNRIGPWTTGPAPLLSEIRAAHQVLALRASRLIYVESQAFDDIGLAKAFAEAAHRMPGLRMILILPVTAGAVVTGGKRPFAFRLGRARQARALGIMQNAFGSRLFVGAPALVLPAGRDDPKIHRKSLPVAGPTQILVPNIPAPHILANVAIFDLDAAIVASASLTGRSLRVDTEAGIYISARNDVTELRHRVMARWLPPDIGVDACEDETAVQVWARVAWQNAANPPGQRRCNLLPYTFATAIALGKAPPIPPSNVT
jgi:hypothetical protein